MGSTLYNRVHELFVPKNDILKLKNAKKSLFLIKNRYKSCLNEQ